MVWIATVAPEDADGELRPIYDAIAAALDAGLGVGVLPCFVAAAHPLLERIRPPDIAARNDVWLVVHRDLQGSARIRAVLEAVDDMVAGAAPLLLGEGSDQPSVRRRPRTPA